MALEFEPLAVRQGLFRTNAQQDIVRFVIVTIEVVTIIRSDDRHVEFMGEF